VVNDLTKGPIAGHLIRFAAFIALTTVFQTLYFLIDLYFVGRLGRDAIAGVGLAGNVAMIVLGLTQTLGVGATSLIAQAIGARDHARGELVFNQALILSSAVGIGFFVVAFVFRRAYTGALAADAATAEQGAIYLAWFIPAMMLQFGMVALGSALRGIGDMKVPTMLQVGTVLVNIVLAPVLIAGWGTGRPLGVAGAGLATFVAVVVGCVAFTLYFRRPASPLRFRPAAWRPDWRVWRQILAIGLPSGGEFALIAVYMAIVYDIIAGFGAAAQAGFGIGGRLMQSLFLPAVAIGFATSPVVGQNFGARHPERVRQAFATAASISAGVMAVITLLCHIAPSAMIGAFSEDPAVIAFGAEYLRIVSWNFVASGIIFAGSSTLQGLGNTRPALFASAMRLVLFAAPAYVLSSQPSFEMRHVWYLSTGSVFVHCAVLLWLVRDQFRVRLRGLAPVPETA
jgi:putative MATE family efflux protein